ncbi:MAG: gamma carbonic anhydrase family protein [Thermodesulfobacteriota bacterium]
MPVYELDGRQPVIGPGTWIAPNAAVIGDVRLGRNCHIGFGAVIRGDFGPIIIGDETVVEDNVVIHTAVRTEIGNRVIIGHMAMVHDAAIADDTLIGMQAMICEGAVIGSGVIVAEQTLVRKNQHIPPGKIVAGSPAAPVKDTEVRHREMLALGVKAYRELTRKYQCGLKQIKPQQEGL